MYLEALSAVMAAAFQFLIVSYHEVNESWLPDARISDGASFDFIIVGGGTAGSTLAARLAEVDNFSVLLIEAGGDPPAESVVPPFVHALKGSKHDWHFTSVKKVHTGQALSDGVERQPRGKMLGGSSSMNEMLYTRGFPSDYNEWVAIAGENWSWDNVLKYFKKTEAMTDENIIDNKELMKYHSRDGAIEVSGLKKSTLSIEKFTEAFEELGFDKVDDMTNPHKIGVGRFSHTISKGQRHSSLTALLNKSNKPNLFILKNALVTKILIKDNVAIGVQLLKDKKEMKLYTNKEIIVTAGTFNTAKLLLLSGVGPKSHLESLGINVVKDLPVGENLQDHAMVLSFIAADSGTCSAVKVTEAIEVVKYLHNRTGELAIHENMGAYLSLDKNEASVPDFGFYPLCIPATTVFNKICLTIGFKKDICEKLHDINQKQELISVATVLLKPKSRGKVMLKSSDPEEMPLIYPGTFENIEDMKHVPEMMKKAWSLADTKYFKAKNAKVIDINVGGCEALKGDEMIKCKAKAMGMSAWHAVGTAAMGSVVDGDLNVYGVKGLRVADGSVMPKIIREDTSVANVMIAEVASDLIKKHYKGSN